MSTLAVNAITNAAGGNTATINGMTPTADSLQGFRNRIINGDMRIDQRNAGASVAVNNGTVTYPVDRFFAFQNTGSSSFTAQRSTLAPAGFNNSLLWTSTTGVTASAAQQARLTQRIEGFNVSDLGWGTASAQTVTVSFWARSSITGTFTVALLNSAGNRAYVATYTISSANTFEYKTVAIGGDTSGTWLSDNSTGIQVVFDLGSGSNFSTTAGSWSAGEFFRVSGSANVIGTTGATFYITGVQLEAGSVATPFERRPYGTELQLCQRYAVQLADGTNQVIATGQCFSATAGGGIVRFPVEMRAAPTITASSSFHFSLTGPTGATASMAGTNFVFASTRAFLCEFTGRSGGGLTAGDATTIFATDSAARLLASAEL